MNYSPFRLNLLPGKNWHISPAKLSALDREMRVLERRNDVGLSSRAYLCDHDLVKRDKNHKTVHNTWYPKPTNPPWNRIRLRSAFPVHSKPEYRIWSRFCRMGVHSFPLTHRSRLISNNLQSQTLDFPSLNTLFKSVTVEIYFKITIYYIFRVQII